MIIQLIKKILKKIIYAQIVILIISFFFLNKDFSDLGKIMANLAIITFWIIAIAGILQRFKVKGILQKIQLILISNRRYLGILMFLFGFTHYTWNKGFIIINNGVPSSFPLYQIFGFISLSLLFLLFITSNNYSVKKLGKFWKTLHSLVYPVMLLLILHITMQGSDFKILGIYFGIEQTLKYGIPSLIILFLQIYSHFYYNSTKKATSHHKLEIINIYTDTKDSKIIELKIPPHIQKNFSFVAGQHVSLKFNLNNKVFYRSYSICNSPSKFGNNSKITISVKRKLGGIISNYINDSLKAGIFIEVSKPFGRFFKPEDINSETQNIYFWAGGSGITPILSVIEYILKSNFDQNVYLIYANRTLDSIMFKNYLNKLEINSNKKLKIINIISDETEINIQNSSNHNMSSYIFERMNAETISDLVKDKNSIHYICGPEPIMILIKDNLKTIGIDDNNIHLESFVINSDNETLYNKGTLVPEDGEYMCIDCGYSQFFKKGEVFPVCPVCLAGEEDSEYEFWKKVK